MHTDTLMGFLIHGPLKRHKKRKKQTVVRDGGFWPEWAAVWV